MGSIPGQGTKTPHASKSKKQNAKQKQIATNSIKSFKMVHIKKEEEENPESPSSASPNCSQTSSLALSGPFQNCLLFTHA